MTTEDIQGEVVPEESPDVTSDSDSSPEVPADPAAEQTPEPSEEEEKKGGGVQKRINEITREKYEAKRKAEEAERRAAQAESKLAEIENRLPPKPRFEDYSTDEEFNKAVDSWTDKAVEVKARQTTNEPSQNEVEASMQKSLQKVQAAIAKATQSIPDIQAVTSDPNFPVDDMTIQYLSESDSSAEVLYHLATHLDKAFEVANLPPAQKFRELAKLEASVEKPTPNKVTNAPNPPTPIGGSDGSPVDPESLSTEEWIAKRNAKLYGGS